MEKRTTRVDLMSVKHSASRRSKNRALLFRATMLLFIPSLVCLAAGQELMRTGRETEERFPPLQVPPQFKATRFIGLRALCPLATALLFAPSHGEKDDWALMLDAKQ